MEQQINKIPTWIPNWIKDERIINIIVILAITLLVFIVINIICIDIYMTIKHRVKKQLNNPKEIDYDCSYLKNKTDVINKLQSKLDNKICQLRKIGCCVRDTLKYIDEARKFAEKNSEMETKITNIENKLLECAETFSPAKDSNFDDIQMVSCGENCGDYVKKTIEPGKKIEDVIVCRSKVERKEKISKRRKKK